MWILNTDTNKWIIQKDTLSKDNYDNLKQDLSSVKLYSKALSGATYLSISDTNNIYEPINYKDNNSWYVNPASSVYNTGGIPNTGISIDKNSLIQYNNYTYENGFTLKNSFTPEKSISDTNYIQVDLATTESIKINSNITSIDGVKLIEGHKVLIKDQLKSVNLAFTVDPNVFFKGHYYLINNNVADSTYNYYSEENGIYVFTDNQLVRATYSYIGYSGLSVNIKLGLSNFDKQFRLSRLLNGYYPSEGDPIEFTESHNYLVRSQVDYHNLFENNYFDILKHGTQSYYIDGFTYAIPERLIYIGDFGVILTSQGGINSQYLFNDYKYNFKSIIEVGPFYWICGEEGSLLKISKIDFSISKIELNELNTLMSISFIDSQRGIIVGKYNTIYSTFDGGYTWRKLVFNGTESYSYSYNKVIYYSYSIIYIVGENGVFLELNYTDTASNWSLTQRTVIKNLTTTDEYELIEDINDMLYTSFTASWGLTYSSSGLGILDTKECLIFAANSSNLIIYEINNFVPEHNFIYIGFSQSIGDITSVTRQNGTNNIIVSANNVISININDINNISPISNLITNVNYSVLYSDFNNKIFDYKGLELYNVGNIGLASYFTYNSSIYKSLNTVTITPKTLIMEYDMANKLNFFDSNYNYRLPLSVTFSGIVGTNTVGQLSFSNYTSNWIDYMIDSYKTYGVNSDTTTVNPVLLSITFSLGLSSLTFSNTSVSLTFSDMSNLYPIVNSTTQSRFSQFTPSAPSNTYDIYMYKYATILRLPNSFCSVGDMLEISSDNVNARVMINYHFNAFYYAYNDFNTSMLNDIKTSNVITITNLNKYETYAELITNFEEHPISNGYKLSYTGVNDVLQIDPRFNNLTAYKSLETDVSLSKSVSILTSTSSGFVGPTFAQYAKFNGPYAIVVDDNENIYVSDNFNFRIREYLNTTNPIVVTIAGTGTSGFAGDGGNANNALIVGPRDICLDSNNNIYFIDGGTRIRRIDNNTNIITTIAGNPSTGSSANGIPATSALFNNISQFCFDSFNNIYISDTVNNKIRKIDALTNIITTFAGTGIPGFSGDGGVAINSQFNNPNDIRVYNNNLYISDASNFRVRKIDLSTNIITTYITVSALAMTFDNNGNFYYSLNKSIHKLDTFGNTTLFYDASLLFTNNNIEIQDMQIKNGNLYFLITGVISQGNGLVKVPLSDVSLKYPVTFNQFGYTPKYSLLNYLSNINSVFNSNKKFYSMPEYTNLPGNGGGSFTDNNIYYDSNNTTTWLRNKLVFGANLKYEYDTLWLNTFVDITLHTSGGIYTKTQMLITKKYYDFTIGGYAIEFYKKIIDVTNVAINNIDIISRNTLGQVSTDLEIFNNINKPLINKNYVDETFRYFNFYDNPIKTKINTDSYTKILLSDGDIKKYITAIIYTDFNNKLVMNVININTTKDIVINNTFNYNSNLGLNLTDINHINTQLAYINFTGGTGSSQELNTSYIGINYISPIDDYNVFVNTPYLNNPTVQDIGLLKISTFDPFFNYQPINLLDIGIDNMYKIPLEINQSNIVKIGLTSSIVNFENNNAIFRLIDGLDINLLSTKYHWILEAEISNAIIGLDDNGIVWYTGIWHSGRWFGGIWYSGTWITGDWYSGTWSSTQITDRINTVTVGTNVVNNFSSVWYDGRWFDGVWQDGTWQNGRWYNGTWQNGQWNNGIWNDGNWNIGSFNGGIWVQGNWNSGLFNSSNKPSYWINGKFYSGDFQNGMWYNGQFGENYNVTSKFGSLATNSRNATWQGGVFSSGNFYSHENGTDVSLIHKYSTWKTGIFNQGNFYGGIVYNIEFQNGLWHGGIVQDIEIIGVSNPTYSNSITLNGVFRYNVGDYVNIINNDTTTPYYNLGNYDNPGRYRVANAEFDLINNWTILSLDYNFNSLDFTTPYNATSSSGIDTGLRLVSKFKNIDWKSGIWYNGVFEGGNFFGGIWYDGVFNTNGIWGA